MGLVEQCADFGTRLEAGDFWTYGYYFTCSIGSGYYTILLGKRIFPCGISEFWNE